MLGFAARAFCLFVVLLPLSAAAQLPVPPHVNLHNGYIEVINHIRYHDRFDTPALVRLNENPEGEVASGGTFLINRCCILAGTEYWVELNYVTSIRVRMPIKVTPRLCNIRGIPFGYAVVEFTGDIAQKRAGSEFPFYDLLHSDATRVDTSCPVEK